MPGPGKTHLLNELKQELDLSHFSFYDGSAVIAYIVLGGLQKFSHMTNAEKDEWRARAIGSISTEYMKSDKVAIVIGHLLFWPQGDEKPTTVCTRTDFDSYTHFIFLNTSAEEVSERSTIDKIRAPPATSIEHLRKWQELEIQTLRNLCGRRHRLFSVLPAESLAVDQVVSLISDFRIHSESYNSNVASASLRESMEAQNSEIKTVMLLDADRTIAKEDTGKLLWNQIMKLGKYLATTSPMEALFRSPMAYSYMAFRQLALIYEETATEEEYTKFCEDVASKVNMYPEVISLLQSAATQKHVKAVIVTCGAKLIWQKVVEKMGLASSVQVIGGGRISDGYVVTPKVKGALADCLRREFKFNV